MRLGFPIAFEDPRPEVRYSDLFYTTAETVLLYNSPVLRDSLQGMWITVSQSALDIRRYDISYVCVEMTSKYHVICSL